MLRRRRLELLRGEPLPLVVAPPVPCTTPGGGRGCVAEATTTAAPAAASSPTSAASSAAPAAAASTSTSSAAALVVAAGTTPVVVHVEPALEELGGRAVRGRLGGPAAARGAGGCRGWRRGLKLLLLLLLRRARLLRGRAIGRLHGGR